MQWLGVLAQVAAIAVGLGVLTACAVRVGKTPDGNELFWKFITSPPEAVSGELSPPVTPLPLSPQPQPQLNRARENFSVYDARKFTPD